MSKLHCVGSLPDEKSCLDCRKESTRFSSLNIKLECDAHRRQRINREFERDERLLEVAPEMLSALKHVYSILPSETLYKLIQKAEGKL